jgi:hypothetical protein
MRQIYLIGVTPTVVLLAALGTASTELVADDHPFLATASGETTTPRIAASTATLSEGIGTSLGALDEAVSIQPEQISTSRKYGALPPRAQDNPHMDFWLLLLIAAIAGLLSEVFHRRSSK